MSDPAAGGTGDGGSNPPIIGGPPAPPPPPPPPDASAQTFSQADLDRIVGQRVAEAQRQETKSLVKDLGFDKAEDLRALVAEAKAARTAQMTEAERQLEAAKTAKAEAEAMKSALAQERHSLSVERELAKAGAQGDTAKLVRLVEAQVGADAAAVAASVDQLKKDYPSLFGASGLPSSEPAGGGFPGTRPTSSTNPLQVGLDKAKAYEQQHQRTGF